MQFRIWANMKSDSYSLAVLLLTNLCRVMASSLVYIIGCCKFDGVFLGVVVIIALT